MPIISIFAVLVTMATIVVYEGWNGTAPTVA